MRILFALAALATAVSAQAAIVTNGSFEAGTAPGVFTTYGTGSPAISGWTIGIGNVDYIGSYWQASDGVRSIDLNGGTIGTISQTIMLNPGSRYVLTFDMSANPDGGLGRNPYDVAVGLTGVAPSAFSYALTGANSRSNMLWSGRTLTFTAVNAATVLSFTSLQANGCCFGPALDNVSVSAVPEPATWSMLIIGFGLVGVGARRRNRAVAAA